MVGSCSPYGGWSHSKRHPLRSADIGEENHRPPSPANVCVRDMKAADIDAVLGIKEGQYRMFGVV